MTFASNLNCVMRVDCVVVQWWNWISALDLILLIEAYVQKYKCVWACIFERDGMNERVKVIASETKDPCSIPGERNFSLETSWGTNKKNEPSVWESSRNLPRWPILTEVWVFCSEFYGNWISVLFNPGFWNAEPSSLDYLFGEYHTWVRVGNLDPVMRTFPNWWWNSLFCNFLNLSAVVS